MWEAVQSLFRSALLEHGQHAAGDAEPTKDVDGCNDDREEANDRHSQVRRTYLADCPDQDDAGDGIRY